MLENFSIGAIGAAVIGGLISLITLIVSKEQKISEFRQEWINNLWKEIVSYLTQINIILDASNMEFENINQRVEKLSPLYQKLNEANFSITLRLNKDEILSKILLECMLEFHNIFSNDLIFELRDVKRVENRFMDASSELLKQEWNRVKRGEPAFRLTKFVIIFSILAIFMLFLYYIVTI